MRIPMEKKLKISIGNIKITGYMTSSEIRAFMKRYDVLDKQNDGRKEPLLPEQVQIKIKFLEEGLYIGVDEYGAAAVWVRQNI